MWASNPDMEIDGHYHPYFNTSESKPDAPAKEKGFLIAEEKNKISYPSLWIKNTDLNQFTGVHSIPIINFLIPDSDSATSKRSTVGIAKYIIDGNHTASSSSSSSLFDYVKEELNELESNVSFQLNESAPAMLSNIKNGVHRIVYTTNIVDSSLSNGLVIMGHRKTM